MESKIDQELRDEFEKINKGNDFSTIMDCGNLKYWNVVVNNDWIQFRRVYSLAQETISQLQTKWDSDNERHAKKLVELEEIIEKQSKAIAEAIGIIVNLIQQYDSPMLNSEIELDEKAKAWLENNR